METEQHQKKKKNKYGYSSMLKFTMSQILKMPCLKNTRMGWIYIRRDKDNLMR